MSTAFASAAQEYERGRPGYPAEAIELLAGDLALSDRSVVVDLAAGTGKLTRSLTSRFASVIAIEPLVEMRQELGTRVSVAQALEGSAEAMPLEDGTADAVFVAQAFHWFDGPTALAEIERVLRPRGGLALLWNSTPWELREGPWFAALDDLLERSRADLSTMRRHGTGRWKEAFERENPFEPLAEATFPNVQRVSREEFVAALASRSYVASLGPEDRQDVLDGVEWMLNQPGAPIEDGKVIVPMRTDVYWTRLRR